MSPAAKSSSVLPALVILAAIAAAAEPECPTKCGDVDIPSPFGVVGSGCPHWSDFKIYCINNGTTPVFQSDMHTMQVLSLSVDPPLAKEMLPVAYKCYNPENGYGVRESDGHVDLRSHGIFRISDDRNMFVVLGCNTGAFTMSSDAGKRGGRYSHQYYAGCFTYCSEPGSPKDGRCASVGCCHVDIPPGLVDNEVYFESWPHDGMEHSPCDIAFLVGKDSYEFRASDLRMDVSRSSVMMPVWLDWAMGRPDNLSCADLDNACENPNTECADSLNGPGYLCRCKQGFQGNPYDDEGCTTRAVWSIVATCFGTSDIPKSFQQSWRWCEKWIPNGKPFLAIGLHKEPDRQMLIRGADDMLKIDIQVLLKGHIRSSGLLQYNRDDEADGQNEARRW